ncbi:MAG: nicotinate-nucleotide--dimethylbenzimidazole phosphoribosyltransferase [Lachnospiraceae bacterium]|nr:nicotinate-nucleotide--dimethylbenzimidazole phosphoribosyltransferase [Lachnospiraceae bacterium]
MMTRDELFSVKIKQPDEEIFLRAKAKWDAVAKPLDGLGDFEGLICRIAAIQGSVTPGLTKKTLLIMCADNGIVREGVSQTGQQVTCDVASLMGQKKSSVGIMTRNYPLSIVPYDVGIATEETPEGVMDRKVRCGTADFLQEPAMQPSECLAAITVGIDAVADQKKQHTDIIATGEMGIGNTTTSTALLCAITGADPAEYTGRGSGLTDEGFLRKTEVIREGLHLHLGSKAGSALMTAEDVFAALCCLGGLDIAALTGVFIGGAVNGVPVVIDGLISAVAALCAQKILPGCRDFYIASHMGREKGMERILTELCLRPVIHADMALGEGTGAVMIFPLLDMALSLYESGTKFASTDIAQYERFGK